MQTESIRLIKKYPNRRLYDTHLRAYITLNDIRKLVNDTISFKVVDARTQKDLTQNTLLQIISEQEMQDSPLFSNSQLENFIRFYNDKSQALFGKFLQEALDLFIQQKSFFTEQWQSTLHLQKLWLERLKNSTQNQNVE